MKVITQHHIGTTEEWKAANPKLYEAVWGFEITKDKKVFAKLGNGTDLWNNLKYFDIENIPSLREEIQRMIEAHNVDPAAHKDIRGEIEECKQAIGREAQEREAADQALRQAIGNEALERETGDYRLSEAIAMETSNREENIKDLLTAIDNVATNLKNEFEEEIGREASERKYEDLILDEKIDAHNADPAAHKDIRDALSAGGGNANLSGYYNKAEIDEKLENLSAGGGDADLSGYYNKAEIDEKLNAKLNLSGAAMEGPLTAGGTLGVGTAQVRNIQAGPADLTAGSSPLATGQIYLVYE